MLLRTTIMQFDPVASLQTALDMCDKKLAELCKPRDQHYDHKVGKA